MLLLATENAAVVGDAHPSGPSQALQTSQMLLPLMETLHDPAGSLAADDNDDGHDIIIQIFLRHHLSAAVDVHPPAEDDQPAAPSVGDADHNATIIQFLSHLSPGEGQPSTVIAPGVAQAARAVKDDPVHPAAQAVHLIPADDDAIIMAFLRGSKFAAPWRTCMRGPCAALPRFPANHPSSAHASIATAAPKLLTEEEDTLATSLQLESSNATNHDAVIPAFHDPAHAGGPSYPRAKRTLAASTAAPSLAVQALACPLMVSNQPLPCQPLPVGDPAAEGGVTTSLFDGRGAIAIAPHVGAAFLEDEVVHPITVDSSYSFLDSVAAAPALQNFVANVLPAANEESAAHIGATLKAAEAIVITTAANDASTFLPHKPAFAEGPFLCSSICPCKDGASSNSFCVQYAAIQPPQANQVPSANAGGIDVSIIINATSARELLLSHHLALRLAANSVAIPIEAATSSNRLLPPTSIFNKKPTLLPAISLLSTWLLTTFDPGGQADDLSRINNQLYRPYNLSSTMAYTYHLEFVFSFRLRGRRGGVQAPEITLATNVTDSFQVRSKARSELLIFYMMKSTLDPG
ncbi:hypothetical protein L7F22_020458 [Adiantum nelumboides]|nr:hypothetical protein [Adiantum nelumboides]